MKEISGKLVYFCASADKRLLEGGNINGLLLNVPSCAKSERAITRTLDFLKASGATNTMLDSGGFQLYESQRKGLEISHNPKEPMFQEGKFNIAPLPVVKTAEIIKPDILVALDFPLRKISDPKKQEIEFQSKLQLNLKWAIQTAELREKYCPKIKLFIPIQCYTLAHLDIFFKRIQGIHYDGVSMPVRNLSLKEISLFLLRFHQMGIKRVHLLGTSSFYTIVLSAFMAHRFFNWISLDSSTWKRAAGYSEYLNPDLTRTWIVDDGVKSREKELGCKCPVCLGKTFSEIKKLKKRVVALQIHNYWTIEKAVRDSFRNSRSLGSVERFLERTCSNKQMSWQLYQCLEELDGNESLLPQIPSHFPVLNYPEQINKRNQEEILMEKEQLVSITVSVPKSIRDLLRKTAAEQNLKNQEEIMSTSQLARQIICEYLKKPEPNFNSLNLTKDRKESL